MDNKRILNYSMVSAYTILCMVVAALVELALINVETPAGLIRISEGLAETGFSVTVITVSILAVITNISERRFYGIKAGEYLKFRRRKLSPGFYDVLIIIVLVGALQYVALAADFRFAAAVIFLEIVTLMIVQLRSGLGIAFFYYGKEKAIRAFFVGELKENLAVIANDRARERRVERAALAVTSRIDNLFSHTKNVVSVNDSAQIQQNLNMMTRIFGLLLDQKHQSVWHNYETRVDYLLSSIMLSEEQSEYAIDALKKMLDIVIETKGSDNKPIAKNCDFDQSRNTAYKMVTYEQLKALQDMFDKQIFYKLAIVKIYGISDIERKVAKYAHYTDYFAQSVAASKHLDQVSEMVVDSIRSLVPNCFAEGKATDTAVYVSLLIAALKKNKVSLKGLWDELEIKQEENEQRLRSVCMIKQAMGEKPGCELSEEENQVVDEFVKLIACNQA